MLSDRQEEIAARGLEITTQIAGLKHEREMLVARVSQAELAKAERTTLNDQIADKDVAIREIEAEQKENAEELETLKAEIKAIQKRATEDTRIGGDTIILGALDKSLIDAVILSNISKIRNCYQSELGKHQNLSGKVMVKFVIARDGSVIKAETKQTTLGNAAVEACLNDRFLKMRFPEPKGGGIVIASYPFVFGPS